MTKLSLTLLALVFLGATVLVHFTNGEYLKRRSTNVLGHYMLSRCIRKYGHSCLGGHGKRSRPSDVEFMRPSLADGGGGGLRWPPSSSVMQRMDVVTAADTRFAPNAVPLGELSRLNYDDEDDENDDDVRRRRRRQQ